MTITVTAENALLAINRFISSIASDFPEPKDMVSIETETKNNAEIRVYAREELHQWINTEAAKDPMKRPKSPEAGEPLDVSTLVDCGKLFSLVLAIVEASGQLEAAIKGDDDLKTFAATSGFRQALLGGRGILESLLKAPGDLRAKMFAVGLPINKSAGQIRLLTHTLGFKPEEFVGYKHPGKELPAYLPPLAAKTEVLIPPVAIHLAQNAMPDPFSPFTPSIGAAPNAAVYNEAAELARALAVSQDEDPEVMAAIAASLYVQQDEEDEVALAMQVSMQVQAPPQDEDPEMMAAIAASLQIQALRQDAREVKHQHENRGDVRVERKVRAEDPIARLEMEREDLRIALQRELDAPTPEIHEIITGSIMDRQSQIERELTELHNKRRLGEQKVGMEQRLAAGERVQDVGLASRLERVGNALNAVEGRLGNPGQGNPPAAMLPAARAAGIGVNAAPNRVVNPPVIPPVVAVPVPAVVPAAPVTTPAPAQPYPFAVTQPRLF